MQEKTSLIKPEAFLRWAGSKRQLLPKLSRFWHPGYQRYIEPFAGSACLFFTLQPENALLADKNEELIEVFSILRKYPKRLHAIVTSIPQSKATYYTLRSQRPHRLSPLRRAVRFMYLNRFCFNGLYRTNRAGQFNVPFASSGTGGIPPLDQFIACADLLGKAQLRAWDFGKTLSYVNKGEFVYIDPPFAVDSRRVFKEYGPKTFSKKDLGRLSKHLEAIDKRGAIFLLSYADCREARDLFQDWHVARARVRRNIAGFAGDRKYAFELLISNTR